MHNKVCLHAAIFILTAVYILPLNRFIGALYGRLIGITLVSMFGVMSVDSNPYWAWMDPGAFALIGAASFFGGVSRLTMSLTVIMVSIHRGCIVLRWCVEADYITHSNGKHA